jgi:hypothetical protein
MAESNFQFSLGPMPSSRTGAHLKKGNPIISQSDIKQAVPSWLHTGTTENVTQDFSMQQECECRVWPLDRAVKQNPFIGSWAEQPNELSLNACGQECIKSPLNRGANTLGMRGQSVCKNQCLWTEMHTQVHTTAAIRGTWKTLIDICGVRRINRTVFCVKIKPFFKIKYHFRMVVILCVEYSITIKRLWLCIMTA